MSRPTGTVVGRFLLSDGSPALGRVHFTPAPERVLVQKDGESSINLPPRVTALLDEEGKFEKVLLATEGPGVDPTGWTYRVDVEVPGVWETPYYFDLPAETTVDLADYAPVPESGGTSVEKGVLQVVAGDNVTVDSSNPQRPIVGVQLEELEWDNLNGVPDTFPPAAHSHTIGEVVGLQDELDDKQVVGDYLLEEDLSLYVKSDDSRLEDSRDPNPHTHEMGEVEGLTQALSGKQPVGSYATEEQGEKADTAIQPEDIQDVVRDSDPRLSDERDPKDHTHTSEDITDLEGVLSGKQDVGDYIVEGDPRLTDDRDPNPHVHPISDVTDLQDALDSKQDVGDYATRAELFSGEYEDLEGKPTIPDVSNFVEKDDPRLSDERTPKEHTHTISDITDLGPALDGKLDVVDAFSGDYSDLINTPTIPSQGIESIVAGGNITVDNTDPLNPIVSSESGITSVEWGDVEGKPSTFPPSGHAHEISDITGLQNELDGKQPTGDYATESYVDGLVGDVEAALAAVIGD